MRKRVECQAWYSTTGWEKQQAWVAALNLCSQSNKRKGKKTWNSYQATTAL